MKLASVRGFTGPVCMDLEWRNMKAAEQMWTTQHKEKVRVFKAWH